MFAAGCTVVDNNSEPLPSGLPAGPYEAEADSGAGQWWLDDAGLDAKADGSGDAGGQPETSLEGGASTAIDGGTAQPGSDAGDDVR
ncbi:MAG: hypothetical protein HYV09_30815 [Deltaproteobacteria bacterium]|nr:hypothetical protein [Deltaproteobacteria bacterium]